MTTFDWKYSILILSVLIHSDLIHSVLILLYYTMIAISLSGPAI
jgi:hypothetical protein